MKQKRILITGGTGTIGLALVNRLHTDNEITVYSRDEAKQAMLHRRYPNVHCVLGDIRDRARLTAACSGHNVGIFTASLKQVGAVADNPAEATDIIVHGALNSRHAALVNGFESACFVSTDKSRLPVTIYGSLKHAASESFLWRSEQEATRLSCVMPVNVLNSTGSVIPLFWNAIATARSMTLYSSRMSRFIMTADAVVDLILAALDTRAIYAIPKAQSCFIADLFAIYHDRFGLRYAPGISPTTERDFEYLYTREDAPRISDCGNHYILHYRDKSLIPAVCDEISSLDHIIERNELDALLQEHNFFKP